jgi:HK97 family phage major capsid protein
MGDTNGCMIFDREQASVEASYEDSTNFQKNMVTVRCEERLAFAIFRTEAFIYGSL